MDGYARRRIQVILWKQWKTSKNRRKKLRKYSISYSNIWKYCAPFIDCDITSGYSWPEFIAHINQLK